LLPIALILASLFVFVLLPLFRYPLSQRVVDERMETHNILTFAEAEGVLVYITEIEQVYTVHIFEPTALLNRYRLRAEREYEGSFITAVQGRFRVFSLVIDGTVIEFLYGGTTRLSLLTVTRFVTWTIFTANLIYLRLYGPRKKGRSTSHE